MSHNHYFRDVSNLQSLDVYRLLELFDVTCPVAQHVVKKALAAGQRGHKSMHKDWQDIADSAARKLEMLREDERITPEAFQINNWPVTCDDRMDIIGQNGPTGEHYQSTGMCPDCSAEHCPCVAR